MKKKLTIANTFPFYREYFLLQILISFVFSYIGIFDITKNFLQELPHGVQISYTFSIYFAPVVTLFLLRAHSKTSKIQIDKYLKQMILYIFLFHSFIWLVYQPSCVTGCEGGSGSDGDQIIFLFAYMLIPTSLSLINLIFFLMRKINPKFKPSIFLFLKLIWLHVLSVMTAAVIIFVLYLLLGKTHLTTIIL